MQNNIRSMLTRGTLPIILIAAVVQGWALYGLHQSIKHKIWPATNSAWLIALYAFVLFVPLTIQFLSEHAKSMFHWILVTAISLAFFYFGWHYGSYVYPDSIDDFVSSGSFLSAAIIMGLLWLLLLPFVQARLSEGQWTVQYTVFFTTAWRNKLMLAEAALFTGLFWLLLFLWAMLFQMLSITYFRELFEEPLFIYPVTTIVFGVALHLIGSVERLTVAILEQLLNVLKWLAILAGVILALFTVALLFKLQGLVFYGQKAIGAAWLLWLVAVMVLLINAAYRDGSVIRPYPNWIGFALRCVVPLTVIIATTALYALIVRARHYGITVDRVWGFVVASAAMLYSIGYSVAAFGKQRWLQSVGRVNVIVAITLIVTIAGTLTPALSPYRIAANSQYRLILSRETAVEETRANRNDSPFSSMHYLRFDAGKYGLNRLHELSVLTNHPDSERIQKEALAALNAKNRWQMAVLSADDLIQQMKIFPQGHPIDSKLRAKLVDELNDPTKSFMFSGASKSALAGVFVDLNDDKTEEFVLLHTYGGSVFQFVGEDWKVVGMPISKGTHAMDWKELLDDLAKEKVATSTPPWKDFEIGPYQYRVQANAISGAHVVKLIDKTK